MTDRRGTLSNVWGETYRNTLTAMMGDSTKPECVNDSEVYVSKDQRKSRLRIQALYTVWAAKAQQGLI